jgi:hypothetical protein
MIFSMENSGLYRQKGGHDTADVYGTAAPTAQLCPILI